RKSGLDRRTRISRDWPSGGIAIGVGSNVTVGGTGICTVSIADVADTRYWTSADGSGLRTCTGSVATAVWFGSEARSSVALIWVVGIAPELTSTSDCVLKLRPVTVSSVAPLPAI